MKKIKFISLMLALCCLNFAFTGCVSNNGPKITNIIREATEVKINGIANDTVEASLGAFEGKQGDYIEFSFSDPQTFNTIFISEKTATVRQYNVYAEIDGKYMLVHTGKHILQDNITIDETTATGIKLEIVNTQIGDDHFIIQGVSAYNIKENTNGN